MPHTILIVDTDTKTLARTAVSLRTAGYDVVTADGFEEGKRLLDSNTPDLLLTAMRLGAFNGLHLVVRGRTLRPTMAAIVVGARADRGLEADALSLGALFASQPIGDEALRALVARAIEPTLT